MNGKAQTRSGRSQGVTLACACCVSPAALAGGVISDRLGQDGCNLPCISV